MATSSGFPEPQFFKQHTLRTPTVSQLHIILPHTHDGSIELVKTKRKKAAIKGPTSIPLPPTSTNDQVQYLSHQTQKVCPFKKKHKVLSPTPIGGESANILPHFVPPTVVNYFKEFLQEDKVSLNPPPVGARKIHHSFREVKHFFPERLRIYKRIFF